MKKLLKVFNKIEELGSKYGLRVLLTLIAMGGLAFLISDIANEDAITLFDVITFIALAVLFWRIFKPGGLTLSGRKAEKKKGNDENGGKENVASLTK